MESLHIKLTGRYIPGTGPKLAGKMEAPPIMTPKTPPVTEPTVPEVVFEDETK